MSRERRLAGMGRAHVTTAISGAAMLSGFDDNVDYLRRRCNFFWVIEKFVMTVGLANLPKDTRGAGLLGSNCSSGCCRWQELIGFSRGFDARSVVAAPWETRWRASG